jgi:hypothetical protein
MLLIIVRNFHDEQKRLSVYIGETIGASMTRLHHGNFDVILFHVLWI